jgi:hypothetical protein
MNLLNQNDVLAKPLKKISETCALVLRMTETEFSRLLKTLELDFPETKLIYKTTSPGHLWIMRGSPPMEAEQK